MPYHYEFSEETGEVDVTIHKQSEAIKRVSPSSIANMYNQELSTINTESESDDSVQK